MWVTTFTAGVSESLEGTTRTFDVTEVNSYAQGSGSVASDGILKRDWLSTVGRGGRLCRAQLPEGLDADRGSSLVLLVHLCQVGALALSVKVYSSLVCLLFVVIWRVRKTLTASG